MDLNLKIRRQMVQAISDYEMIADGDRIMVAVSGGKDSTILLLMLAEIQRRAKLSFELQPVILDQKQPGFQVEAYRQYLKDQGLDLTVIEEDTYAIVKEKVDPAKKSYCGLCSRLRRGILYNYAHSHGYNKIALGHHRDDLNETILMNLFYGGRIASMPPKLRSDDGRNVVIRPLAYVPERQLVSYAEQLDFPIIPCNLCGSQDGLKRQRVKRLLRELEEERPDLGDNMLAAMKNIRPTQLLDGRLHNFSSIEVSP